MAIIDVTKELADILTSAFGKGWGWVTLYLIGAALKKATISRFLETYYTPKVDTSLGELTQSPLCESPGAGILFLTEDVLASLKLSPNHGASMHPSGPEFPLGANTLLGGVSIGRCAAFQLAGQEGFIWPIPCLSVVDANHSSARRPINSTLPPRDRARSRNALQVRLGQLGAARLLRAKTQLCRSNYGHTQRLSVFLEFLCQRRGPALDVVSGDIRIQHETCQRGSCDCGGESSRFSRKSSGTSSCSAKNDDQFGLTGVMNNPSPCLRIRTSLTSAGKRNSCGSRTAWLAPLRNMDARLATALDIDLAAVVTALPFPVSARFIPATLKSYIGEGICFAYAQTKMC
jgi:hypothetical protein